MSVFDTWREFFARANRNAATTATLNQTRRTGADVLLAQMGEDARRQYIMQLTAAGDVVAQFERGQMELARLEAQETEIQQEVGYLLKQAKKAKDALAAAIAEAGDSASTSTKVAEAQKTFDGYRTRGADATTRLRGLQDQIDAQEKFVAQLQTQADQAKGAARAADQQLAQSRQEKDRLTQLDAQRRLAQVTNASMKSLADAQTGGGTNTAALVREKIEGELADALGDQTIIGNSAAVQQVNTRMEMMASAGADDFEAAMGEDFIDLDGDGIDDRLQRKSKTGA